VDTTNPATDKQVSEQASAPARSRANQASWKPGNSGNPTGRRSRPDRIKAKLAELRALYEPSPLLPIVATHLVDGECHSACNFDPVSRGIGVQN
jgi:hypothetical protein